MSEKEYRITTNTKQFETDYLSGFDLKEENGIFYISEKDSDNWQKIINFEKLTSISDKIAGAFASFFGFLMFGAWIAALLGEFIPIVFKIWGIGSLIWLISLCIISLCIILCKPKPYFVPMSDIEIKKIIESNTWRSGITTSSKSYKNYSSRSYSGGGYSGGGSGGARSGSYSGGSSGGGYSEYSGNYISSSDLDKALKVLESDGKDWNKLANSTTDEERENLFSQYFKNEQKGKAANDKFNREQVWPARTETLNNILNEAEYEDETTKENLNEKIRQFDSEISNEDFQKTAREIRKYQERKKLKDNHVKYEGRLSNKDVKAIKDVLGYVCMGCGLDPLKEYGAEMKGILEAHHKTPWAEIKENEIRTVKPDDFYILCPNCHRMIHKLNSPDDLNSLREVLNQNKKFH